MYSSIKQTKMREPISVREDKLRILHILFLAFNLAVLLGCGSDKKSKQKLQVEDKKDSSIEIISEAMDFKTVDEIPAGWHTFRYINRSDDTHFFLLDKYPEGKTLVDGEKEVIPPFQRGMNLINQGKAEEGYAEFNKLPAWFFEIVFSGGSGLVSPGHTAETTIKMEPGYYVIECYVKMENGVFHTTMGMVTELIVTDDIQANNPSIKPNIKITLSSQDGIVYNESIKKGEQTFEVYFKDQIAHENFVGHDINLVKLDKNANLETLEKWMNWADPKGLISPAPPGFTFLGGVNDMPAGSRAYFTTYLEPGRYVLVSEVPNSLSKNMLKTFIVTE